MSDRLSLPPEDVKPTEQPDVGLGSKQDVSSPVSETLAEGLSRLSGFVSDLEEVQRKNKALSDHTKSLALGLAITKVKEAKTPSEVQAAIEALKGVRLEPQAHKALHKVITKMEATEGNLSAQKVAAKGKSIGDSKRAQKAPPTFRLLLGGLFGRGSVGSTQAAAAPEKSERAQASFLRTLKTLFFHPLTSAAKLFSYAAAARLQIAVRSGLVA